MDIVLSVSDIRGAYMDTNELSVTPLTQVEKMLKHCFQIKPVFKEHIPNKDELMEYVQWMIQEFGDKPEYRMSAETVLGPAFNLYNNRISSFSERLLDNPHDTQALNAISEGFELYKENMFISIDNDISAGRMLRYMPSHWHSNDHFEFFYSISGDCPVHFTTETVIVKPGTVLIIAPNVTYASPCFDDECSLLYYILRASTFDRVFWNQIPPENLMANFFRRALNNQHPNAYLQFETEGDPDIRQLLIKIYNEFMGSNNYRSQMMNALMSEFFVLLLRGYEGTARLPRNDDFYWKHEYSAILSHIQTYFATVTLTELSERFHYSEKQIRRIIQNNTGMSFLQLITKLRMEKARALLQYRNITIEMIATSIGYTSINSFYRTFARYYGCTPGQYIEKNLK